MLPSHLKQTHSSTVWDSNGKPCAATVCGKLNCGPQHPPSGDKPMAGTEFVGAARASSRAVHA